jgi:hypothetical protein
MVTIEPPSTGGLVQRRVTHVEVHTHLLAYTAGSTFRLFKAQIGQPFRDITGEVAPGSVRTRGTTPGWSQFLIVADLRPSSVVINEKYATVKKVLPGEQAQLRFDYDFGDRWEHDVVVEAIETPAEGVRYPICLAGERACPPEDCGGPSGYERLLTALADPADPEHDELKEWIPDGFDPEAFDVVTVNKWLRRL